MGPSGCYSGGSQNSAITRKEQTNTTQKINKQQAQTHQANMHKHTNKETYVTLFGVMLGLLVMTLFYTWL
jgi:isocitrate lyase